jgi:hypothetical protein
MNTDAERWSRYGPHALRLGIRTMLGFKLLTEEEILGALNLYSSRPEALTERSEQMGWLLASHAAVAFSSGRSDANLHGAISSRQDIGIAIGILMERRKLTADEAFTVLSQASMHSNTSSGKSPVVSSKPAKTPAPSERRRRRRARTPPAGRRLLR